MSNAEAAHRRALLDILPLLETSTDGMGPQSIALDYDTRTPAQRLRGQADNMERRDNAILAARAAIAYFTKGQP